MSENQLKYKNNCRKSVLLCSQMEQLIEQADYYEKLGYTESREIAVYKINEIKLELDLLWDEQIYLFYQIQYEYRFIKKAAVTR